MRTAEKGKDTMDKEKIKIVHATAPCKSSVKNIL
jgi:hypothetical protein